LHHLKGRCGEDVAVSQADLGNANGAKASLRCARTEGIRSLSSAAMIGGSPIGPGLAREI
jgi:hypothetical protein